MHNCIECYSNKFKIPEHLKPLKKIPYSQRRLYQRDSLPPKSLLDLCCDMVNSEVYNKWLSTFIKSNGDPLLNIVSNTRTVVTDSARSLCHLQHPQALALYLLTRAKNERATIGTLLRSMRIILDETTEERRRNLLQNHWDRILFLESTQPCILIGSYKHEIR